MLLCYNRGRAYGTYAAKVTIVQDPALLINVLKIALLAVMVGAVAIIFREIVAMARGQARPAAGHKQGEQ